MFLVEYKLKIYWAHFNVDSFLHLDWSDHRSGQRYGHGSSIRRLSKIAHIINIYQIGIRDISSSLKGDVEVAHDYGVQQFKKGFNEHVEEYIGDFIKPIHPLFYKIYQRINK